MPKGAMLTHLNTLSPVLACCYLFVSSYFRAYGKCSKILNTFLLLFSNKMLVFSAGSHKMLIRITNREDPDQTDFQKQSDLGLCCFVKAFFRKILEHLP